jgi:hypothetical protein
MGHKDGRRNTGRPKWKKKKIKAWKDFWAVEN